MATQHAIEITGPKTASLTSTRPLPALRPDYILIKTAAVALNPTDWKHIDFMPTPGALSGCDFSGTVEDVGSNVRKTWKKGDRVAGFTHGANMLELEDGAFAEHIVARGDVMFRVPEAVSFEDAAAYGVGVVTVGQALYESLKLPLPSAPAETPFPVLIYGGSTATGLLAMQFAKLSGLTVVTTCSPKNSELVKAFGADVVFDYRDEGVGAKIREATRDQLYHAFDTISEGSSIQICADALSSSTAEGVVKRYSSLLGVGDFPRPDVAKTTTIAYGAVGEPLQFPGQGNVLPPKIPANTEDYNFMVETWIPLVEKLIGEGKIKVKVTEKSGGLAGVLEGLQELREGKVSGEKLVYRVA